MDLSDIWWIQRDVSGVLSGRSSMLDLCVIWCDIQRVGSDVLAGMLDLTCPRKRRIRCVIWCAGYDTLDLA